MKINKEANVNQDTPQIENGMYVLDLGEPLPTRPYDRKEKLGELNHVAERLETENPNLLKGRLPEDQEALLGEGAYAIGINQTSCYTSEEASVILMEGIELFGYSPSGRFLIGNEDTESQYIEPWLVSGYFGDSNNYRFIAVFPVGQEVVDDSLGSADAMVAAEFYKFLGEETDNSDSCFSMEEEGSAVKPEFIAGYIDQNGKYVKNPNFGRTNIKEKRHRSIGSRALAKVMKR